MAGNQNIAYRITIFLTVLSVCIVMVDRPLAVFVNNQLSYLHKPLQQIMSGIELLFGFTITKYLVGFLLLATALLFYWRDKHWQRASVFLFIGTTHIISRLLAGILKNVFHRSRPYQFIEDRSIPDFFTEEGSSFPSGHAAHFFGLFLPLIFLFPKYKWPLLVLPVLISLQRILVNDHYISDVLASVLLVLMLMPVFARLFKVRSNFSLQAMKL